MSEDSNAMRRFALLREVETRWDELSRFKQRHEGMLSAEEEAELRRLRSAWTEAAQRLFKLDNPG